MGLSLQNANFHLKFKYFKYDCKPSNLYILIKFKKLVIVFLISKNTPNLINLSLFLKLKRKKKGSNCKSTKIKNKKPSPCSIKLPTTPCSSKKNKIK